VDFGAYSTAVSNLSQDEDITFSFALDRIQVGSEMYWIEEEHYETEETEHLDVEFDVTIGPSAQPGGERTTVRKVQLRSRDPKISFELVLDYRHQVEKLIVDDVDITGALSQLKLHITAGSILPELIFLTPDADPRVPVPRRRRGEAEITRALAELIRSLLPKTFNEESLQEFCAFLVSLRPLTAKKMRETAKRTNDARWKKFIEDVAHHNHPTYSKIRSLLAVAVLTDLLRRVDQQLRNILSGVLYIGPARARSERYYRYQDLSVSEIDPDGKNFPMFLNSLPNYQIKRLSSWIEGLFGYGISIRREGGHISIDLIAKGNKSNIVDTGYGVSQILPVLGQIWWARSRPPIPSSRQAPVSLLAIEQPELHLHPAHQALLADALVGEVGLNPEFGRAPAGGSINFIVETHSETLVNRLGELVNAGRLNHSDVQIVMFEPDPSGEHLTTIRTSSFNESGELVDWPYGFFQPSII